MTENQDINLQTQLVNPVHAVENTGAGKSAENKDDETYNTKDVAPVFQALLENEELDEDKYKKKRAYQKPIIPARAVEPRIIHVEEETTFNRFA